MWSKLFWKDVLERLVATLAQVAVGLLTADQVLSLASIPWQAWLTTLAVSGVLVVFKALAGIRVGEIESGTQMSPASLVTRRPDDLP